VFIGASATTVETARVLLKRGHAVVVIEKDKERAEAVTQEIDCGCLHGDGSRPAMLRQADPGHTDFLFCLTDDDQANILASLVGRTLGFKHVVCKIQDSELIHLCVELGLDDVIVPAQTIGRRLAQMFEGRDPWVISARIRGDARLYSFVARAEDAVPLADLDLPRDTRVVCLYREDELLLPDTDTKVKADDEVVLVTHSRNLEQLAARWEVPPQRE
jgi:trk system potassium uptake protein TrkA